MSKGIFHDLILEEYEKSCRKTVDVVGEKRSTYSDLLSKANECLKLNQYEKARHFYNLLINLIADDPYPDEYNLEDNTLFCLKCCLGYCDTQLYMHENLKKAQINATEKLINDLIDIYPNAIMPYYLKLLLESQILK